MNQRLRQNFDAFPSYRGGHTTLYNGYVYEFAPDNPRSNLWGYTPQHVLVAEDTIGRTLHTDEVVHHRDEQRTNNAPDNLEVMTQRRHRAYHGKRTADINRLPLTESLVRETLAREGGIKPAARVLGCSHSTLRGRFPELCQPYQRTSPTKIDNPRDIELIFQFAADPQVRLSDAAKRLHMSPSTIANICRRNGVAWIRKTKKGEIHQTHPRKWANPPLEEIARLAADPNTGMKEAGKQLNMGLLTLANICRSNGIAWVHKSRKGEVRRTYRKKPTRRSLEAHDPHSESETPLDQQ